MVWLDLGLLIILLTTWWFNSNLVEIKVDQAVSNFKNLNVNALDA